VIPHFYFADFFLDFVKSPFSAFCSSNIALLAIIDLLALVGCENLKSYSFAFKL